MGSLCSSRFLSFSPFPRKGTRRGRKLLASAKNQRLEEGEATKEKSFSPHPFPLLAHPLPTSPEFFAHRRPAPSLARFFARSAWKRKGRLVDDIPSEQQVSSYVTKNTMILLPYTTDFTRQNETIVHILTWFGILSITHKNLL